MYYEQPKFVANFVTVAARAISLQRRNISSLMLKKNLVDNTKRIVSSKIKWCHFVVENIKDVYNDVKQKMLEAIMAIEHDLREFETLCDPQGSGSGDQFYENVVKGAKQLCHSCCEAHDLARASYVRIVETDVTLAIRSLSICLEAVQSRVKLVETFELGTLIFARLAESCSSMAIQSTTPETLGKVLTEYFNSINDLNEALAGKINSFILAQSDADREDAKINLSKSIQQLETLVLEVQTIVQEELASVDRQDYFQEFIEETEEVSTHNKIRREVFESELEHISNRGAASKLNKHTQQTGIEPSPALRKLAADTDQISVLLQEIYFALANSDANLDIEKILEKATPAIMDLPKSSKQVLMEEANKQDKISSDVKLEVSKSKEELRNISNSKAPALDGKKGLQKIIQTSIRMASPGNLLMGDNKTDQFTKKLSKKFNDDSASQTLDLDKLTVGIEEHLELFAREINASAEENRKMLMEIDEEMLASAKSANEELISAAMDISKNGMGVEREANLLKACEKVESLMEISHSLIPYAEEDSPWGDELEPEVDTSKPINDLFSMLLNPKEQLRIQNDSEAESQLTQEELDKMERRKRREEDRKKKLKGIIFSEVQKIEKRLEVLEEPVVAVVESTPATPAAPNVQDTVVSNVSIANDAWTPIIKSDNLQADNIWKERGRLLFEKVDGKWIVKAGSFNQLVIHLTSPLDNADDALAGSDFFRTFMMTLQTFTEPETFVAKLIERYDVPACPEGIPSSKNYELDLKHPVQMRVCNVLKKWIVSRYDQDLAHKPKLIEDCFAFINDVVVKDSEYLSKNLRQCLTLYISGERFLYLKQVAEGKTKYDINGLYKDAPELDIVNRFDAREVARQITLIDAEMFRAVRLYELAGQAWNKKDAATKSPNLTKLINHTNHLSIWVASVILKESKIVRRRKVMNQMILLCQYLLNLRNYHSVMGVLAGLSSSPVSRLKFTKRELPAKSLKILTDIENEMSSASSFRTYRASLHKDRSACVPFLGVILSDLTFMEDGNPDFTENGLINWQKRTLLYTVLSQFLDFQGRCFYNFPELPLAKSILGSVNSMQVSSDELYATSLQLEPRGGVPPELVDKPTIGTTLKNLKGKATDAIKGVSH